MIKVNWDIEEAVALVSLYHRTTNKSQQEIQEELVLLSSKLKKRADILKIDYDEKFRNLNGMKMMYQNIEFLATGGEKGMSDASKALYIAEDLYQTKPDAFSLILEELYHRY